MVQFSRYDDELTDFLFARPSVVEGLARLGDFFGALNKYNRSTDPDAIAIRNDWRAIGRDIARASHIVMGDRFR